MGQGRPARLDPETLRLALETWDRGRTRTSRTDSAVLARSPLPARRRLRRRRHEERQRRDDDGAADAQTATVGMNDKLKFDPTTVNAKVGTVTLDVDELRRVPHNLDFTDEALGKTSTDRRHGDPAAEGRSSARPAPSRSCARSTRA